MRVDPAADLERALRGLDDARAPSTARAYRAAWEDWQAYRRAAGGEEDRIPIGVESLLAWLSHCEERGLGRSALRMRASAVRAVHEQLGHQSPTDDPLIRTFLKAAGRRGAAAGRSVTRKRAVTAGILVRALADASPRDRAILLVGYVSGLRREELAALEWSDVREELDDAGEVEAAILRVRMSKTDQEGAGRWVGLPVNRERPDLCPVRALQRWSEVPEPSSTGRASRGRVFRCSGKTIARVVKRACERVGLDPLEFGAHSMRRGMITEARRAGVPNAEIMGQSGHASEAMLPTYTEQRDAAENRAARAAVDALRGDGTDE